jgi:hypothetical protein
MSRTDPCIYEVEQRCRALVPARCILPERWLILPEGAVIGATVLASNDGRGLYIQSQKNINPPKCH